ncbi:MAG: permease prefix domain 2-containing transporter [Bacteroidota bacterium]
MSSHALPPSRALRILQWFVRSEYLEEIEGDLEELYQDYLEEMPPKQARRKYLWEVVRLFRPALVKHISELLSKTHGIMIRNNLKIAWRSMAKQKGYTAIKLGSFALGVAACLLVALYLRHELSYDRQVPDHESIYRVAFHFKLPDMEGISAFHSAPFAATAAAEFPEVVQAARLNISTLHGAGGNNLLTDDMEVSLYEERVVFGDPELLQLFRPKVLEGDLKKALAAPNTLVLTESRARKYFPRGGALGGVIYLNGNREQPWTVSAVVEDVPTHSHLQYDVMLTQFERELWPGEQDAWDSNNYHTYLKLQSGTDPEMFVGKLNRIIDEYMMPTWKAAGYVAQDFPNDGIRYQLMPIADIHLHASGVSDAQVHSDVRRVRVFGFIALFILLLACVNFVNLATARSAHRAKEVGLRKTLGSIRRQLIGQFLTESVLLSAMGVLLGVIIATLALPYFNYTIGEQLVFHWWTDGWLFICLGTAILLGVLSGLYPAIYLSTFQPIQVLKGALTTGVRRPGLRNGLVGFQFLTAMVLIFGTVVVNRQMDFIHSSDLGFNKEQVQINRFAHRGSSLYHQTWVSIKSRY